MTVLIGWRGLMPRCLCDDPWHHCVVVERDELAVFEGASVGKMQLWGMAQLSEINSSIECILPIHPPWGHWKYLVRSESVGLNGCQADEKAE